MTVRLLNDVPAPSGPIPLIPLRAGILFPHNNITLRIGRKRSLAAISHAHEGDIIAIVPQIDPSNDRIDLSTLHRYGTYARVLRSEQEDEKTSRVVLQGLGRLAIAEFLGETRFDQVLVRPIPDQGDGEEALLFAKAFVERLRDRVRAQGGDLNDVFSAIENPWELADKLAAHMDLSTEDAVSLLGTGDVVKRLRKLANIAATAAHRAELQKKVENDVRAHFTKQQRDAVIREQMRALRRELSGEEEEEEDELDTLASAIAETDLPEEVAKTARRELKRLRSASPQSAEAGVIRNYLDWILALPWNQRSEIHDDLQGIREALEEDHYGLAEPKKRVLEHHAVLKLSEQKRGGIMCLVGPPGTGKTSIARSIARATGREFVRIALGGVRDEAEIRGHRRTYVGATAGRILHALRQVKQKNPVILLDEVDKLAADYRGSPEAALLELLDPEQNVHFTDHYLELPFDLSEAQFICTANSLDTLSAPLRDRMEIISISGYTEQEKCEIAQRYLIPKRLREAGIPPETVDLPNPSVSQLIRDYTREAGVRQLDRTIQRIARALALEIADEQEKGQSAGNADSAPDSSRSEKRSIDDASIKNMLGKAKFRQDMAEGKHGPGVATGLAWTPFGGDILYIETSRMPGHGKIQITGQLGDVMKESARAAFSYVRSRSEELGIAELDLDAIDLHIHVPAGAVPKDGPSAGVTMFSALYSLLTGKAIRADTAMTGECTLRGRVLAVGGIKAKVLAAHRTGIRRVILPRQNEADIDEIPEDIRNEMEIITVEDMSEVLAAVVDASPSSDAEAIPPIAPGAESDDSNQTLH